MGLSQEIYRGRRYSVSRLWKGGDDSLVLKLARKGSLALSSTEMLRHEFELLRELAELGAPGVVRALALEDVEGMPALVLEDAGPGDLRDWLKHHPLEPDIFLEMAIQLAEILGTLHRHHVIHRDINPTNIIVKEGPGHLTVIDFDIATKVAGPTLPANILGELELTLPYVAPEQTGRMDRLVDHRADLYSLGATFYEMLTGQPPFLSSDPIELVHAHLARPPLPPVHANPKVPELLSALVLKLLAKMPEERYQSADSLLADLQEARKRKRTSGMSEPFELGRLDSARQLPIPERLYGRERELTQLEAILARVRTGTSERVMLTGTAGIGKSALIRELGQHLGRGVWFLTGKFDQLQGNVPYAPLVAAFQGLLDGLAKEPADVQDTWRHRLLEALGTNGRLILGLVPELEQFLGPQPALADLMPTEAERLLHLTVQAFIQAFATPERPLVLFLDDLQWADPASIKLLQHLASDLDSHHVLWSSSCRIEEVGPEHPITRALEAIQQRKIFIHVIAVSPLDLEALTALCADTLRREPSDVRPLAELVLRKTAGNPLFVTRFLKYLHHAGLLSFDVNHGTWEWTLSRIAQVDVTENVVELMLATIRRLPERTQGLLKVAACLGHQVDLSLLAALVGRPVGDTAGALLSAIQEGLLLPQGTTYRFAHDRVQQAAYSLLSEDEKKRFHLEAGRQMRAALEREQDERLFDMVDQLDLGADLVTGEAERLELAQLNFRAGAKAKASAAFRSALGYLTRGIGFLPAEAWRTSYEQTLRFHKEAAECAYLVGDLASAERFISSALLHSTSRFEKADLYILRILASMIRQSFPEALQWGREGLRLFGMELPEKQDTPQALVAEFARVKENRRGRSMEEILEEPTSEDPEHLACMRLLTETGVAVLYMDPELFAFINTRVVNLSLKHGNTRYAPTSYAVYGGILSSALGDYATGHAFGRLGVELCRRYTDLRQTSRTLVTFALGVNHWRAPLRTSIPFLRQAFTSAQASGDLHLATYTFPASVNTLFAMGTALPQVLSEIETDLAYVRKAGLLWRIQSLISLRQAIRSLQDRTHEHARFGDDTFDEEAFLATNRQVPTVLCMYWIQRHQVSYFLGDVEDAWEMSRRTRELLAYLRGWHLLTEHNFYTSLTLAARYDRAPPEEKAHLMEELVANQRQLGIWAENCPENYRHKHQLISAELARIEGHHLEALRLYDQAIEAAHREQFLHEEALASELAGRYYLSVGGKRLAHGYLRSALEGYARWGAQAKVSDLEEEFPELTLVEPTRWDTPAPTSERPGPAGSTLDLLTLLKSAETLVSEVVLERLLEKLMGVCLEAAGAQRGALVLEEKDSLRVRAVGTVSEPVSLVHTSLEESDQVPSTVIEHAYRSGETLVLADAAHQGRFSSDPYVVRQAVKSALAIPIQRPGRTMGVLYLENNLATRAFTTERVRVLRLLSSQIAISLENSLLFEQLRIEVEERRRAEQAVRFLAEWSLTLSESLDFETTLAKVTRSVVPYLADWCVVDVVEKDGRIRRVALAHMEPAKEQLLREMSEKYPPTWSSPEPIARTLRTGQPVLLANLDEAVVRKANLGRDERYFDILRTISFRTGMVVPLVARGKTLGSILFVSSGARRRYTEAELNIAQEMARRAAVCIDNAWLYREAQEAIHLRDDFLSVASHELNTPITSLRLSVQGLMRRAASELPQTAQRALRTAEQQTRKLAGLIKELLEVSRIHAGRLHLQLEWVDLSAVLQEVVERQGESLTRAECPLTLHVQETVAGRWDRSRLEQVIGNLLSNAIKFAPGRPIELSLSRDGGTACLVVKDQGIGIAPDRMPHIFGRFERAVSSENYGGLGLGLYIVHEIVTALGGAVRVESKPGEGATFTVELPCAGPPSSESESQEIEATASSSVSRAPQ
ncbi:AAA family ATPase [Archangium violaceum]|uniref:GAF domain-containing sensor histidine kinase n=1 Tax=Archangium violaceum TaxID=83451 RepID=UPI00194F36AA|nr:ATP-binding sensor histidine kinase [Archangium violaceum]QRN93944.1 AAA family ATPase [Archangium violaceum]